MSFLLLEPLLCPEHLSLFLLGDAPKHSRGYDLPLDSYLIHPLPLTLLVTVPQLDLIGIGRGTCEVFYLSRCLITPVISTKFNCSRWVIGDSLSQESLALGSLPNCENNHSGWEMILKFIESHHTGIGIYYVCFT